MNTSTSSTKSEKLQNPNTKGLKNKTLKQRHNEIIEERIAALKDTKRHFKSS